MNSPKFENNSLSDMFTIPLTSKTKSSNWQIFPKSGNVPNTPSSRLGAVILGDSSQIARRWRDEGANALRNVDNVNTEYLACVSQFGLHGRILNIYIN